jgi:hypothetical protein
MPVILKKDKGSSAESGRGSGEPLEASLALIIGAGLVLVLFLAVLYHFFVNPIVNTRGEPKVTYVKPLPGFPDTPPYNTKEWQEAFKQGRASLISGIPPNPRPPSGPSGGAQGTPAKR